MLWIEKIICKIGLHKWSKPNDHQRVPMERGIGFVFKQVCLHCSEKRFIGKLCGDDLTWKDLGVLNQSAAFRKYYPPPEFPPTVGMEPIWFPADCQPLGWREADK